MMNKYILSLLSLFVLYGVQAQTTINGSFLHDGITRTYSFYVPASYTPGNAVPLVIGLHGLSSSGAEFAQYRDFKPIADTANFIIVNPDGSSILGIKFWNYGSIGSDVDDVGFLQALIDTISAHYTINQQRVYCTGMSNGSFMTYYMACETNRFAAIAGVTGSMSTQMYGNCHPSHPTPALHIHGTDDGINPYEGTSSMVGIDALNRFWVDQNHCDTVPVIFPLADINTTDGATATRYVYTGGVDDHTVELFKVTDGGHSWPGSVMPSSSETTCMDFSASKEIWRFFSQYTLSAAIGVEDYENVKFDIWPNPASDRLYIQAQDHVITEVSLVDLQGKLLEKRNGQDIQFIDLGHISSGTYLVKISGEGFSATRRVVVPGLK